MIEAAAAAHEPHRIAFYLYDLASEFHGYGRGGGICPYLRFIINNDAEITKARLALVQGVVSVHSFWARRSWRRRSGRDALKLGRTPLTRDL